MRELKNSNALRDTEKRLPNDLQEVEKYADGQPQQDSMRQNILL
jgi:cell wall assembly regulator SMI1